MTIRKEVSVGIAADTDEADIMCRPHIIGTRQEEERKSWCSILSKFKTQCFKHPVTTFENLVATQPAHT